MIIPSGYAQVNIKFTGNAVPRGAETTFGVQNVAARTADQIADLVGDTWVAENMDQAHVSTCDVSSILVKLGPNSTGPASELAYSIPGTLAGNPYSPNTATMISKVTGLGGRHGRGRMFLPGQSESYVGTGGIIDSAVVSAIQVAASNFLAALDTADAPMVLLHATGSPSPTPVTSLNVAATVVTQRRRLRK